MGSLKSRIIVALMRNRHLLKLKLRKEKYDDSTDIAGVRADVAKFSGRMKAPTDVTQTDFSIGPVQAVWFTPAEIMAEGVVLYFHGGGYCIGSVEAHRPHVAKFAKASGVKSLLFGYGQAPEMPYPVALDDAMAAYQWLLDQGHDPRKIVFVGDSAGAGLCLALILALKDRGLPLPAAAAPMSPFTDLTLSGDSHRTKADVCLSPIGSAELFSKLYAGDNDRSNPLISPLFGDLADLPPLLIYAGDDDVLRDDSVRLAEKARAAGVDVRLHVEPGMFHCYPVMSPLFPEAKAAMDDICAFVRSKL